MNRTTEFALIGGIWVASLALPLSSPGVATEANPRREPAHRVAIYSPALPAYLTLDGISHVEAASLLNLEIVRNGALHHIFPGIDRIRVLSTVGLYSKIPSDPEQLIGLNPDAILVWPRFSRSLKVLGLPVVEDPPSDPAASWSTVAAVAGKEARGRELVAFYRANLRNIEVELAPNSIRPRRRIAVLWRSIGGGFHSMERDTPLARAVASIGADNALPASGMLVDVEQLLSYDPEAIFLPCCNNRDTPSGFYNQPSLRPLTAVREGKVYVIPQVGFRMDGLLEYPLLLQWMNELVFPEAGRDRVREAMRRTYRFAFGVDLSNAAIDRALAMEENRASSGYERFAGPETNRSKRNSDAKSD